MGNFLSSLNESKARMNAYKTIFGHEHRDDFNYQNEFKEMFANDSADIHFVIYQNEKIVEKYPAHKALLSIISPVFNVMFNDNWKAQSEVDIVDASASSFKEFLTFFYQDAIPLTEENIYEVLNLTVKYQVDKATHTCFRFLVEHLSASNVIRTFEAAKLVHNENAELKDVLFDKFVSQNTINVLRSQDFLHCTSKTLASILKLNSLACDEKDVFDACIGWARNACEEKDIDSSNAENLRKELGDCFQLIRYNEMDEKEFAERYRLYQTMFSKEELSDIFLKFNCNENNENLKYRNRETKRTLIIVDKPVSRCTFRKVDNNTLCFNIHVRVTGFLALKAVKFFKVWDQGNDETVSIKVMAILMVWRHKTNDSKLLFTALMHMNSNDDVLSFKIPPTLLMKPKHEYTIQLSCQPPIRCLNEDNKEPVLKGFVQKGVSLVEWQGKTIFSLLPQDSFESELRFQHFK